MPQAYNRSVYEVFGGLRERWPNLTTVAALNWEEMPADIPVTVWVDEYAVSRHNIAVVCVAFFSRCQQYPG